MAKVILKLGCYTLLMPSKAAAMAVLNAMLDSNELEYTDHDAAYDPIYSIKAPLKCAVEYAGRLKLTERKSMPAPRPEPHASKSAVAPKAPRSAEDLWNERSSSGNIVPHSSGQKATSPKEEAPQVLDLRPVPRGAASAKLALIVQSLGAPEPEVPALPASNVIALPAPRHLPAQATFFLEEKAQ